MSTAVLDEQTSPASIAETRAPVDWKTFIPEGVAALAFVVLFYDTFVHMAAQWWDDPDAGHGLLLAPLAVYLAWKRGLAPERTPWRLLGLAALGLAVLLRVVGGMAAELLTMRVGMFLAMLGLIVFYFGFRQLVHWWLPLTLFMLSIPLPVLVLTSLAFPLQLKASQMGAALLEWRHIPVFLNGNVIHLPGRTLFVAEACSGLRSLASLIALGVLIGGLWLRSPLSRILLVLFALPVAMFLNGIRVFLTGFLVFFVDPKLGEGFMHLTEGWIIFVVAFGILGAMAWVLLQAEDFVAGLSNRKPAPVEPVEQPS
jgi:exosortase